MTEKNMADIIHIKDPDKSWPGIRMIGIDLDKTALRKDKSVSSRLREAIQKAAAHGVLVVPTTGRALYGLPDGITAIREMPYVITANGAVTSRLPEKTDLMERKDGAEILRGRYIGLEKTLEIYARVKELGGIFVPFIRGYGMGEPAEHAFVLDMFRDTIMEDYSLKGFQPVRSVREVMEKVCAQGLGAENLWITPVSEEVKPGLIAAVRQYTEFNVHIMEPKHRDIEIGHPEADKGIALLELGETLGIGREQIMAIGDNDNDMGMLTRAAFSACPDNAAPQVLETADWILPDCDHDGVAHAIDLVLELNEK